MSEKTRADLLREKGMPDLSTPRLRLAHTLEMYDEVEDDRMAIHATGGVYGSGVVTGLTWGDLRAIAAEVTQ